MPCQTLRLPDLLSVWLGSWPTHVAWHKALGPWWRHTRRPARARARPDTVRNAQSGAELLPSLALGELEQARAYYRQALQIAADHPQAALNLDVSISQAALLAQEGRGEQAVEQAALALRHPASNVEVRQRARASLDQLEAELPPAAFAAARKRGQSRDLEATVEQLLTA
jgi:hypothetical protein